MERLSKENEYQRQGNQLQYTNKILEEYIYTCIKNIV